MKIGMNLLLWTDNPTAKEHNPLLTQIKEWGFDGVEFQIAPMSNEDIRLMSNHCDELGLGRTTIIALGADVADPASSDKKLRDASVEQLIKAAEQTKAIGADLMVGPIFQGLGRFTGTAPTDTEWQWATETIRKAAEFAKKIGVRIAIEPLNRFEMYMVNTVSDGARFVEQVDMDNVGLLVDTHHGNIEELNVAEAWKKVSKHIFHIHISENHRGIPGSGHAIPDSIFAAIKEIGYDDWVTIEAFNRTVPGLIPRLHLWRSFAPQDSDIATKGLQFIKSHLQ